MKKQLKKVACLAVFVSAWAFSQQQKEVKYFKDTQEVTEKDDWNQKIEMETATKGEYNFQNIIKWDKEGRKTVEYQAKKLKDKEQGQVSETEYNYKYGYKEVTTTTVDNGSQTPKQKCLSLEDKVIYADKPCTEDATLDAQQLRQWVAQNADVSLLESSIRSSFIVRFSPDGTSRVEEVDGKKVSEMGSSFTEFEKDLIKKISNMPPNIYRGKLRKALGKEIDTLFRIPVYSNVQ